MDSCDFAHTKRNILNHHKNQGCESQKASPGKEDKEIQFLVLAHGNEASHGGGVLHSPAWFLQT